jgi:hypothetical protein
MGLVNHDLLPVAIGPKPQTRIADWAHRQFGLVVEYFELHLDFSARKIATRNSNKLLLAQKFLLFACR